ncbi:MAG: universal stress protein [Desulfosarcina sp.]|nr:universal stress protein [Desulfosarcina sp.]MBC2767810.1 universal stress protein [Desulfosarcina sp.]
MTQEIKRILYATDLSENSAYAFGYAISLAKKYDAEITILHVIDETMESSIYMLGAFPNQEPFEEGPPPGT